MPAGLWLDVPVYIAINSQYVPVYTALNMPIYTALNMPIYTALNMPVYTALYAGLYSSQMIRFSTHTQLTRSKKTASQHSHPDI